MSKGNCDCCDRRDVELTRCWTTGLETFACDACLDWDDELRWKVENDCGNDPVQP